jgi:glutathione S-transferase
MNKSFTLQLYHNQMSTCSAKVRLVLAEKGLSWSSRLIDLRAGDNLRPEYLKLNRNGVVPTLIAGDRALIESTVICEYIDDLCPSAPLRPSSPWDAAQMRLWTKQVDEEIHSATGIISFCIAFREQFLTKSQREIETFLAGLKSQDRRDRLKLSLELGIDAPFFATAVRRMTLLLDDMEASLRSGPWLAGNSYTLADIALTPYVARLNHLGFEFLLDTRPRLKEWTQAVADRNNFEEAIVRWYDPDYLTVFAKVRAQVSNKLQALAR